MLGVVVNEAVTLPIKQKLLV